MAQRTGRNDPCPCGSGRKHKRCCLDLERRPPEGATGTSAESDRRADLTLLVETPRGVMARLVPSASPLRSDVRHGDAAEAATHDAAAVWGLPDFVYLPEIRRVGSGTRELGDGFIIVGDLGIVIQVKGREVPSSDPERERSWLLKNADEALSQGSGTLRQLERGAVVLTDLRGREVEIDPSRYRWLVVAVLDHPDPPEGVTAPVQGARNPSVVMLRRDWEFLFDQLKSTHAVAGYLDRVAGEDLALGDEPVRYYDLAQDDAETPPGPMPAEWAELGEHFSTPMLPMAPAAHEDRPAHAMVRTIFEDVATTALKNATEAQRLATLAELDRLPVGQRGQIGRFMLEALDQVTEDDQGVIVWRMRSVRGAAGHAHLGFGACSRPHSEELQGMFSLWAQLRHHDVLAVTGDVDGLTTVAVLLTPRDDRLRPWDTTSVSVSGPVRFSDEELTELRRWWPTPGAPEAS
jgi:hypothetical protein